MSTDVVSPLRQRMIEDMAARKLGPHSQRSHIHSCRRFAAFLKRSPDTATPDDVRRFQLHLIASGVSICNRNRIMTGVKFLFRVTLRRHDLAAEIYHIKEPRKLPVVMSPDEAKRLLAMTRNLKVRVLLALGYGCGLRAGEVVRLKAGDIDSAQNIIRVVQAKGRKDRPVMLPPEVLTLLRQWWKVRPTRYDAGVALAVPRAQAGQADDDAPAQPPVPRDGRGGRHQEAREPALAASQLCDAPARARD
jgi:integrase